MVDDPQHPALSPAEWQVMKVLWRHGARDARGVFAELAQPQEWAYPTVKTLLSRLVAKGAVTYERVGNSYLYRPAVRQDEMTREEVRSLLDRVVGAAVSPVLAHFIDQAEFSEQEIRRLRTLLDEKRRKRAEPTRDGGVRRRRGRSS